MIKNQYFMISFYDFMISFYENVPLRLVWGSQENYQTGTFSGMFCVCWVLALLLLLVVLLYLICLAS